MSLLTQEEIRELTGAARADRQAQVLESHPSPSVLRGDKKIATTWEAVNSALRSTRKPRSEPDFSALNA
jgi:hypothetical protein